MSFRDTFAQYTKVSDFHALIVTIKQQRMVVLKGILSLFTQNMRKRLFTLIKTFNISVHHY